MRKVFLSILFVLLFISSAIANPVVWMDISGTQLGGDGVADTSYSLAPGGDFWANIYISELPAVYTMGFDLKYDNSQLNVIEASAGGEWVFMPMADFSSDPGIVYFAGGSALGLSVSSTSDTPDILLASLHFSCVTPGQSILELASSSLSGTGFFSTEGGDISDSIGWENAVISQVPIPATALLFLSGILGLVGVRRKLFR